MKSTTKKLAISLLVFSSCTFFACHKDATTSPSTNANPGSGNGLPTSLQAFYSKYGAQTQTFSINATTGGSFKGAKGGKFFIAAHSLVNSAMQPATGTVTVQVKEIYSPVDMILSNMPTMAGTRGLLSEGEYNINFAQGNNALHIDTGAVMNVHIPLPDSAAFVDSVGVFTYTNNTWNSAPNSYGDYVSSLPDL